MNKTQSLVWLLATFAATTPGNAQTIMLFDGSGTDAWTTESGAPISDHWEIVDGALHRRESDGGGTLLTRETFEDFDLRFEWRIAPGGNSGIKYRVRRFGGQLLGCEYQMIDLPEYANGIQSTGSLYAVYAPSTAIQLRPVGLFNQGRVRVRGNLVEHWLNGHLIVRATIGSCEWNRRIAASKFADAEGFGSGPGQLMLQDHGSQVWFRNISITPLKPCPSASAKCPTWPTSSRRNIRWLRIFRGRCR